VFKDTKWGVAFAIHIFSPQENIPFKMSIFFQNIFAENVKQAIIFSVF
jgi:hypothetical protein